MGDDMIQAPIPTENQQQQRDNTKMPPNRFMAKLLPTNLGRFTGPIVQLPSTLVQ